ncbi:MAG: competence/damage-inducible protein A [Bacteroidales bacterium]|nr:competence/damage-inducible protein A [Bacteroidales bacterium]
MIIEIISIGDELLIGQVVNTNAAHIAESLSIKGYDIHWITTVKDTAEDIKYALDIANSRADVVIATGGLGPTQDDRTKEVLVNYFGGKLVFDESHFAHIKEFFHRRNMPMLESNRQQAYIPDSAEKVPNHIGTASGMLFKKDRTWFFFLPGVPFEMMNMIRNEIIPRLQNELPPAARAQKTILTFGLGESFLAEKIADIEAELPKHIALAYLPSPQRVRLRLIATGNKREQLQEEIDLYTEKIKSRIPHLVFGEDDQTMEAVVGELLKEKKLTLACAESCTGGGIAHRITSVPGSSEYFQGSIVAYSNDSKINILQVSQESISNHGAVSETVVKQMAENVRKKFNADIGVATTGVAGPGGGTKEKPVGMVWIAVALPNKTVVEKKNFGSDRERNTIRSVYHAINMVRLGLLNR